MRALGILLVVPLFGACRFGFNEQTPDAVPDIPDAVPDAAAPVLACGTAAPFPIDATPAWLTAIATADGYDVFTVDAAGNVHGFVFELTSTAFVLRLRDVALAREATGPVGAITIGTDLLLAVPKLTGTELIPLQATLATRGTPTMYDGWFGGTLARAAAGSIAFLGAVGTTVEDTRLEGRIVRSDGSTDTTPLPVVGQPEHPSTPMMIPSGDDVLVVWSATTPSPNQVRASVLTPAGAGFTTKLGSTIISSDPQHDTDAPRAAYSAAQDRYLVAWFQKGPTGGDEIWGSVRTPDLAAASAATPAVQLGTDGVFPAISAGQDDFLAIWKTVPALATAGFTSYALRGARVTPDGSVTPIDVSSSTVVGHDVVTHNGQPALVWAELGAGDAIALRFDPLCN